MIIIKGSIREIEIQKDFMDTSFRVKKIESLVVVRYGFDDQISLRREVNDGVVFFAVKLKTGVTAVTGMLGFYSKRETNTNGATAAFYC